VPTRAGKARPGDPVVEKQVPHSGGALSSRRNLAFHRSVRKKLSRLEIEVVFACPWAESVERAADDTSTRRGGAAAGLERGGAGAGAFKVWAFRILAVRPESGPGFAGRSGLPVRHAPEQQAGHAAPGLPGLGALGALGGGWIVEIVQTRHAFPQPKITRGEDVGAAQAEDEELGPLLWNCISRSQ
jgi:hypothetical protein